MRSRKRRRYTPPYTQPFANCTAPNQVWCIDFKGWFRTSDGTKCHPLTLTDAFSRYLLRCEILLEPCTGEVWTALESAFDEFGLPEVIRSDNGPPFASTGPGGLTELSVWWTRLGIRHERIEPGKPQQNGRHERFHLTLKQEAASPPEEDFRAQQRAFDRFRRVYNEERPHEALGQKTPAELYVPSARPLPAKIPLWDEADPDSMFEQSLVDSSGRAKWGRYRVDVGTALKHQLVNFRVAGDRQWLVTFGPVVLGVFDETRSHRGLIRPKRGRRLTEVSAMSPV